jgi:hypothetical protein
MKSMLLRKIALSLFATVFVVLSACQQGATAESVVALKPAAVPLKPVASIQEVMQALVDPSADDIWNSVSTTVTKKGVEDKQPHTDAQWHELRLKAIRLVEGATLLQLEGRKVVQPGARLEDDHVETNAKLEDIVAAIGKNPAAFSGAALTLQTSAIEILAAIDTRDIARLGQAGSALDAACESCHVTYWYPKQVLPRWDPKADIKKSL